MKAKFSVNSLNLMKNCVNFFVNFYKNSAKFSEFLAKFYARNFCLNSAKFSTKNSRLCTQNLQNKICQISKDKR